MRAISIMVKPASSKCNFECDYCFYKVSARNRKVADKGIMKRKTAKALIEKAIDFAGDGGTINFLFQGGEPLLAGKEFYYYFLDTIRELTLSKNLASSIKNSDICNTFESKNKATIKDVFITLAIQTNASLIDDEWCDLFRENNMLIGVSLDGGQAENIHRKGLDKCETLKSTMRGIECLKAKKVEFNILCVVTKTVARQAEKVYDFFAENDFKYLQFIQFVEPEYHCDIDLNLGSCDNGDCDRSGAGLKKMDTNEGSLVSLGNLLKPTVKMDTDEGSLVSLSNLLKPTVEEEVAFLNIILDRYICDAKSGKYTSIRLFDNIVNFLSGKKLELCGLGGKCSPQLVVEGNGDLYPCDFFCDDNWRLGNIGEISILEAFSRGSVGEAFFVKDTYKNEKCKTCSEASLCVGGCKRYSTSSDRCSVWKEFLPTAKEKLMHLLL